MDLVKRATSPKDPASKFVSPDELRSTVAGFLNKRASRGAADSLRDRLLVAAKRLYANTAALNRVIDDPKALRALLKTGKPRGYWASHLISLPLLGSATEQLAKAIDVQDVLLAVSRLVGAVEDQPDPVREPRRPRVKYSSPNYHQVYKYLMQAAGWPADKVAAFDNDLNLFSDQLVGRLAAKVQAGKRTNNPNIPRPKGW
jgi:hypothetical protein